MDRITVNNIEMTWDTESGVCTCAGLPVALLWIDSTMSGLMAGMQAMVGTRRFGLALQAEGRKSVADDWAVISQFSNFEEGFEGIAQVAVVAGWGRWRLEAINREHMICTFRVFNSWEAGYQKALGKSWGSHLLAGKLAGYCSRLFETNCWAEQTRSIAKGDPHDEFVVAPSQRSIEEEIEGLLATDEVTRADMAVAITRLAKEIEERKTATEERSRLEAKVQHSQKLESLGVLAGGIAHDFNNLLVSVMGNADLGLMQLDKGSAVAENLHAIIDTAQRAGELCNQLLAYSGKGLFVRSAIDLSAEANELGSLLQVSLSKKTTIHYDLHTLPCLEGDANQIRQVLMNLLTNASESYLGEAGDVYVTTGVRACSREFLGATGDEALAAGEYVYVRVRDSGCGMSEEAQRRVFDPFYTTKVSGRGLGLAAVLGIIRGHKGVLKIESEEGRGTSFMVFFPILANAQVPQVEVFTELQVHAFAGTVLLVDDEQEVREVTSKMLNEMGFEVLVASRGQDAVEAYTKHVGEVALVVCDLMMPDMDGEEVYRELYKLDPAVKMILCSGYNEHEVTRRFVNEQLAGFLQKPYRLTELVAVVGRALAKPSS